MRWRLAGSLATLLAQVNAAAPERSKASDGQIGDAAHAARRSDHNPNQRGVVCALDITHDPEHGCDAGAIAEAIRKARDPRVKYVIWNKRLFSATRAAWSWQEYTGDNPHQKHVHISVRDDVADDQPWPISSS